MLVELGTPSAVELVTSVAPSWKLALYVLRGASGISLGPEKRGGTYLEPQWWSLGPQK